MAIVDINLLMSYVESGLLRRTYHSSLPISIFKYTEACQYGRKWDSVTMMCRGLIVDHSGNILARPFGKFFNLSELTSDSIPKLPFKVYEKYDGSLGILFHYDGKWLVATSGSFHSTQAESATFMILTQYAGVLDQLDERYTYLLEIVYPENRIVVKYDTSMLVLLGVINTETGEEIDIDTIKINIPLAKTYDGVSDYTLLKDMIQTNQEGYVVKFDNNFRMKIKGDEYVRLHSLHTHLTTLAVWQSLIDCKFDDVLDVCPDEYHPILREYVESLTQSHTNMVTEVNCAYDSIPAFDTQKEYAMYVHSNHYSLSKYLFAKHKGYDVSKMIWNSLKPSNSQPLLTV
jgi:RNA ligase